MCGIRSAKAQIFYLFLPVAMAIVALISMLIAINLKSSSNESRPAESGQATRSENQ